MSETTEAEREAKRREPSPLVAEVEERLRDIVQNGAEPWNDPAEVRRATRRRDMEIMRLSAMEAALHTTEYICGRLPARKREPFEKVTDPIASLANLNRAIVQITLAEDRFDESAEERAARIKAEADAKIRAAEAALAEQDYTARQIRRAENKRQAHGAIRAIALDHIRLPRGDREDLLANLFDIWEAEDAYDADPAETVADACAQLALTPRIVPDAEIQTPDGKIDIIARKTRLLAFARKYLDVMRPVGPDDDGDESDPADPRRRQPTRWDRRTDLGLCVRSPLHLLQHPQVAHPTGSAMLALV
jgi:hypothetical protein